MALLRLSDGSNLQLAAGGRLFLGRRRSTNLSDLTSGHGTPLNVSQMSRLGRLK